MNNPYIAPTADMTTAPSDTATYQPRIFSLNGRIGRLRFLAYSMLLSLITSIPLTVYVYTQFAARAVPGPVQYLLYLPVYAAMVWLATRRFADIGNSRWWAALVVIPVVSLIPYLYLLFKGGDEQANDYGPPPCANSRGVVAGALVLPLVMIIGIMAAVAIPAYQGYVQKARAAHPAGSKL